MIALLAFATIATAPLPSVFGMQLGAPIALPECERMQVRYPNPDGSPPPYLTVQGVTCQQLPDKISPDRGVVYFPPALLPTILGGQYVGTLILDGKLASISGATVSHNASALIVQQLSQKFGGPLKSGPSTAIVEGIAVPSSTTIWRGDHYWVTYETIGSNIDYGSLIVETDAARSYREAAQKAEEAKRTPL